MFETATRQTYAYLPGGGGSEYAAAPSEPEWSTNLSPLEKPYEALVGRRESTCALREPQWGAVASPGAATRSIEYARPRPAKEGAGELLLRLSGCP
jgi:hypothetical protein